jgi:hypothetical protein
MKKMMPGKETPVNIRGRKTRTSSTLFDVVFTLV